MRSIAICGALALLLLGSAPSLAATVRVPPILLDVPSGALSSSVRIWNDAPTMLRVQVRVFKWTVANGRNVLQPTHDVVVSPPMTALAPNSENVIRVVRVANSPVEARESYRLIIDQLPDPRQQKPGTVNVLVRHAIPLYFE